MQDANAGVTPPTQPAQPAIAKPGIMATLQKVLPPNVRMALMLFFIAGDVIVFGLPRLFRSSGQPSFWVFLITGLVVIITLAAFINSFKRLGIGFNNSTVAAVLGYSSVIVLIKFVLAPQALYRASANGDLSYTNTDQNSLFFYLTTALLIMFLYLLVFRTIYKFYLARFEHGMGKPKIKRTFNIKKIFLTTLLIIGVLVFTGGMVVLLPLVFFTDQLSYLTYTLSTFLVPIFLSVLLAIYMASRGFREAEQQSYQISSAALLSSFYWIGMSLIVIFHIMWIIFMFTLVTVWPLKTVYSK